MKKVVVRMALRNLFEHRRKSLTVGIIIAVAAFLFMLGSSLLDSVTQGIKASYRDRFTGDLYVTAKSNKPIAAYGWATQGQDSMTTPIPLLSRHADIKRYIEGLPGVEAVASRAVAMAQVSTESSDAKGVTILMGIEPSEYAATFPEAFKLTAGSAFDTAHRGLLASNMLGSGMGKDAEPGKTILLSSIGMGSSIRETTVNGALAPDEGNPILGMMSYVDIDTLRGLLGYYAGEGVGAAAATAATAPAGATSVSTASSLDEASLFGGSNVSVQTPGSGIRMDELLVSLRSTELSLDPEAWQYIVIKAKDDASINSIKTALNKWFASEGINASVHDWQEGAGMIASSVVTIKNIFYYIFLIVAAVALLIIMNALIISVTERTAEIGTMRAIGASRKFVSQLITWETLILATISGLVGILLASGCLGLLAINGIPASNFVLKILFGGAVLRPTIQLNGLATAIAAVAAIGLIASWYPTQVALRVNPSTAMQRD